jgi:hypothetical protein
LAGRSSYPTKDLLETSQNKKKIHKPADVEVKQTLLPWLIVEMMCKLGGGSAKPHERTLHGPETKDIILSQVIIKTNLSQLYTLI